MAELSKIPTMSKGLLSSPKHERRRKARAPAPSCGTNGAESSSTEGGRGPRGVSEDSMTVSEYRRWARWVTASARFSGRAVPPRGTAVFGGSLPAASRSAEALPRGLGCGANVVLIRGGAVNLVVPSGVTRAGPGGRLAGFAGGLEVDGVVVPSGRLGRPACCGVPRTAAEGAPRDAAAAVLPDCLVRRTWTDTNAALLSSGISACKKNWSFYISTQLCPDSVSPAGYRRPALDIGTPRFLTHQESP